VKPRDLEHVRIPGSASLDPTGSWAVVSLSRIDFDEDGYTAQLWRVPTAGGPAVQLTYGYRDSAPRVSPDGRWIAFTRADSSTAKPQPYVMATDGGEPRRLGPGLDEHRLGTSGVSWSPDSTRVAYAARVPEEGRYAGEPGSEPPRRITELWYRVDNVGFTGDRRRHIFVVDLDGGAATRITDGDFDHAEPDWSPDGQWLVFVGARHESHGVDLAGDLYVARPDGTDLRRVTQTTHSLSSPRFTADGSALLAIGWNVGPQRLEGAMRSEVLWSVPVGGGELRPLLDTERYCVFNVDAANPQYSIAQDSALFLNQHRGAVQLLRVRYDGSEPEVVLDGEQQVVGVSDEVAGVVVATVASASSWGELVVLNDAEARPLTEWSAEYRAKVPVLDQRELNATAPDGYPVHGWVVRPEGDGPHPVLLMIHGGPYSAYAWGLFDEAQVYAGAGYAVVMGNPRGSSGYGEAHGRAIIDNVGPASATDLLALLDAALEAPDLDGTRVGVLGGSHGGFMTTWMAGNHGERFKAAVSERAVNMIDSFVGSSDIGWFFADVLYGTDPARHAERSPMTYAKNISAPMLIIHSEHDWRCPVEQAQRLYVELKRAGKPVEMLLFPGEGHELSRSGLPSHRLARFDAILDWFNRYV
jgi:dipeptidyl aminopeptidase/acylaminoacyl peptidase